MSTISDDAGGGNVVQLPIPTPPPPARHVAAGGPPDVSQALSLAKVLADSGLFADARGAAQAAVKILAGRELDLGPVASMTGVNVIKGRVTLSANLIAATIRRSGRYDYRVQHLDNQKCALEFLRDGAVIGTSTFSLEDARTAGLAGGDNWRKFPRNMLFARAMSNGAKWYCPDVFCGPVYTADELDPGARLDPETGELRLSAAAAAEAELPATLAAALRAQVAALVVDTSTDLSRFLDHYHASAIEDLTPDQCAEALEVLSARKHAQPVPCSH
jgi:hypothetical protein